MESYSKVVAEGMKRVTNDLSIILQRRGFVRAKSSRSWQRDNDRSTESVHLQRRGSSYGAPRNASVDLRLTLGVRAMTSAAPAPAANDMAISDQARRPTGYAYHHRFNAATGSTYDRCVEELELYVTEIAEPWFAERRRASEGQ